MPATCRALSVSSLSSSFVLPSLSAPDSLSFSLSRLHGSPLTRRPSSVSSKSMVLPSFVRTVRKFFPSSDSPMASSNVADVSPADVSIAAEGLPSWETLSELANEGVPRGMDRLAHARERLFGSESQPRVVLYRDNSSWCPYCERVWLQLEEKRIPYRVEKINMRCYGPKPAWYTKMVPSGLLPAVEIDGKLITESLDIMAILEETFPSYTPLLPPFGSPKRKGVDNLLRLERQLMGAWLQWLTRPGEGGREREGFEGTVDKVEKALGERGGPYFLGEEFSLVDCVYAPFLERIAASIPFWKGYYVRGNPKFPFLNKWFDSMDSRPIYFSMKSDDFTITHCLEPQIGRCYFSKESEYYRGLVEGTNGSWDLPLQEETTAWGFDDGTGREGVREEAAKALTENHEKVVGFALRGLRNGEEHREAVSVGFRHVAFSLLKGVEEAGSVPKLPKEVGIASNYLRDRIGVPRDLTYPAARQLRAHLNRLAKGV